jgi:hypothetical protein
VLLLNECLLLFRYRLRPETFEYTLILKILPTIPSPQMPQYLQELKIPIQDSCELVDMLMLSNVWSKITDSSDVCSITNGTHIEIR